jgi:hypothetical protein
MVYYSSKPINGEKTMKKLLLATVALFGLSTATLAENFDNTSLTIVASSDTLDYKLHADSQNELTGLSVGFYAFPYTIGENVDANMYVELGYGRLDESLNVDLEYQVKTNLSFKTRAYGALSAEYTITADDTQTDGALVFAPYAGLAHDVSPKMSVFAEAGYDWEVTNDWTQKGGYVEVGGSYMLTDTTYVQPSVVRTFDTGADDTQAKLEVGFVF